jgi:two-component system cell cycle sensor histidine kinase/response regulator CckA
MDGDAGGSAGGPAPVTMTSAAPTSDVNAVIAAAAVRLRDDVGARREVVLRLASDLPPAAARPDDVEAVVTALARLETAPPRDLVVETALPSLSASELAALGLRPGVYLRIAVGAGGAPWPSGAAPAPPAAADPARLAAVSTLSARIGGATRVVARPGGCAMIEVFLPTPATGAATPASHPSQGTETVLVIENEQSVREVIHDVLTLHGYTVIEAADGDEALRISERYAGPIHLLVVDVVMPGTSGEALVQRIAAGRPGIRTLYVSGYTDDLVRQHGVIAAGRHFLQKPFTVDGLARKVRQVLEAPLSEATG